MSTQVQKSPQFEFPNSRFPIDIVNIPLRDARSARAHYLSKRFQLSPEHAAAVATIVFGEARQ
jgi:hypothetical protein